MMANSNLQFRLATLDDADRIQQIVQAAFRAADSRPNWTGDMELSANFVFDVKSVTNRLTNPESDIIVAIDSNNALVGSLEIVKRVPDIARFSMLAVDHRQHRGGIGRQLLAYAENYCQQAWAVKKFELNALSTRQELIAWYMRCGYRKTGETSPFPREHFPTMTLPDDLCFMEMDKDSSAASVEPGAA